ncbi:DUF5641 domain-containing protein [Trichonephila clavipes]|nr:DUF5641 domain-containing protein [Trichonephila clavipes]
MAFRRFVSRRGRCSTVYCDNGTNFGGAANVLRLLDWKHVERQGAVIAIKWKFNPPTAAWWGDIDAVDSKFLTKRIKYRQNLIKDLKERFRSEYLGTLTQRVQKRQPRIKISIGGIVLVEADNKKRIDWPLGRISQLILGRDGEVRLVRVQTSTNELLRPIQRKYPLEVATSDGPQYLKSIKSMDHSEESDQFNDTAILEHTTKFSKSGRRLNVLSLSLSPERLNL